MSIAWRFTGTWGSFPNSPCVRITLILCWSRWGNEAQRGWVNYSRSHLRSNLGQIFLSLMQWCSTFLILANLKFTVYQRGINGIILVIWNNSLSKSDIHHLFWPIFPRKQKFRQSLYARNAYLGGGSWRILRGNKEMWGMAWGEAAMISWENTPRCSLTWHTSS